MKLGEFPVRPRGGDDDNDDVDSNHLSVKSWWLVVGTKMTIAYRLIGVTHQEPESGQLTARMHACARKRTECEIDEGRSAAEGSHPLKRFMFVTSLVITPNWV